MINKIPEINIIDKYWFDNNPALTHFMSALSVLFPEGEKFFMQSITSYLKENPQFRDEIIEFSQQERNHTLAHLRMNIILDENDILKDLEIETGLVIKKYTKYMTRKQKLIVTLCLEHITALLADALLDRRDLQKKMTGHAKDVWIYHATEEASDSHRSIATKVYNEVSGSKLYLKLFMLPATIMLANVVFNYWSRIYKNDSTNNKNIFNNIEALDTLFGINGFITGLIPSYIYWYKN